MWVANGLVVYNSCSKMRTKLSSDESTMQAFSSKSARTNNINFQIWKLLKNIQFIQFNNLIRELFRMISRKNDRIKFSNLLLISWDTLLNKLLQPQHVSSLLTFRMRGIIHVPNLHCSAVMEIIVTWKNT